MALMKRLILSALVALAALPAAAQFNPLQPPAVEFPERDAWINSKPMTLTRLRGRRVILLAFIDTANLHSRRAIQTLNKWHDAFSTQGVMIVGVHTPLYGFQKDLSVVRRQVKALGIQFPIVVDNDRQIWSGYQNEGWPAFYLINGKGRVVFSLLGEQRYAELESSFRQAAWQIGHKIKGPPVAEDPPNRDCGTATTEKQVVMGASMIDLDAQTKPSSGVLGASREGELSRRGEWTVEGASLRLNEPNRGLDAFLRVVYRGSQAFAVIGPPAPGQAARFFIKQDDLWLHPGNAGTAVEFDDDGRSYVTVSESGLYDLAQNTIDVFHTLTLYPQKEGSAIYSFSFADRCLRYDPPAAAPAR
jgi:hypothetical protein